MGVVVISNIPKILGSNLHLIQFPCISL